MTPEATHPCMAPGTSFSQPPPLCPPVGGLMTALCGGGEGGEDIGKGFGLVHEN